MAALYHLLTKSIEKDAASELAFLNGEPLLLTTSSTSNNICIYSVNDSTEPLAFLEGHSSPASLLKVSADSKWLCSVSDDRVLLWQLEVCFSSTTPTSQPIIADTKQIILFNAHSDISSVCFSTCNQYIAFSYINKCFIIDKATTSVLKELTDHSSNICSICFLPHDRTHLVTVDNRSFKLWDITEGHVLIESNIITSTFNCLSVTTDYIVLGSTDSRVRLYSIRDDCSLVRVLDVKFLIKKLLGSSSHSDPLVDKNISCVHVLFWPSATPSSVATPTTMRELVDSILGLVIICDESILVINSLSGEIIHQSHSGSTVKSLATNDGYYELPSHITICRCLPVTEDQCILSIEDLFSSNLSMLKLKLALSDLSLPLSVLSSEALVRHSPLKAELLVDTKKCVKKSVHFNDKPVTFKSTVKSSGYLQAPRTKLFQPQISKPKTKKCIKTKSESSNPSVEKFDHSTAVITSTVNISDSRLMHSAYNDSGSQFACAGTTPSVYLVKCTQPSRYSILQGHMSNVKGVSWSHGNSWLLSCSSDKTARLWSTVDQQQCLLTISHNIHNFKHKTDPDNKVFTSEITNAIFYYLDKFILLTSGNTLYMYKYFIDPSPTDDIKRYQVRNYYKKVISFTQDTSHSITALSAINDFNSYTVMTAGSNRSLTVYDINKSQEVWSKQLVHSHCINWITQNKGSRYCNCNSEMFDLFMTSSINDGIKLWDLRSQKCIRWYTSYQNRSQSVTAAFSPCGRYIATGSEEHSVVIYDLQYISPVAKLHCPSSIISSVNYNPKLTELIACSLDGNVFFFTNK